MKTARLLAIAIPLLFVAQTATAGSANGTLVCVNKKKGIVLEGDIPGDHAEFTLSLKLGSKELKWSDKKHSLVIFNELKKKVFTMEATWKGGPPLRLYALPGNVKTKGGKHGAIDSRFTAVLDAPHPDRPDQWMVGKRLYDIQLTCTYNYSI